MTSSRFIAAVTRFQLTLSLSPYQIYSLIVVEKKTKIFTIRIHFRLFFSAVISFDFCAFEYVNLGVALPTVKKKGEEERKSKKKKKNDTSKTIKLQ
jgi:hypothetical protein